MNLKFISNFKFQIVNLGLLLLFLFVIVQPVRATALANQFTVSFWVNPTGSVVSKALAVNNNEIRLFTDANGYVNCQIYISSWQTGAVGTTALPLNQWSHVTCTYDKANIRVFINGIAQGTTPAQTGTVNDSGNVWKFGQDAGGTYGDLAGTIDEVKIYNYARTQAQIMADMGTSMTQTRPQTTKNPVGYWKFDEGSGTTAKDLSGNNNNGTITGAVWNNDGKFGKALQFDGNGDYVNVGSGTSLDLTSNITLSAWVKPGINKNYQQIIVKNYNSSTYSYYLSLGATANDTKVCIFLGGTTGATWLCSNSSISLNQWSHVLVTYDGSLVNIYINGVLNKSYSGQSGSINANTGQAVWIGSRSDTASYVFSGLIDEVKIYNYALTSDEVKQDYNRGQSIMLGSTGVASNSASAAYCIPGDTSTCSAPVAEWNFDEGSGATVKDTSGNNNNGTWSGTGSHWTNGKAGKAGQFNGSDDYVTISNPTGANLSSLTISAWVYGNTYTLQRDIIDSGLGGYQFVIANGGTIYLYKSGSLQVVASSAVLNTNRWYYVTVTYDGSVGKIYIDGVLNSSASVSTTFTPSVWVIGNYSYGGQVFNGKIDQLKIYNYARTPAQVAWDYNKGAPVAHWKMDECTGTTIHDISGNGNNGTLTNATAGDCNTNASTAWYNGRTGKFGASIKLDGSDDYITAGNAPALRTMESNLWTLSAWIYPNVDARNYFGVSKGSDASKFMVFYNNNSRIQMNTTGASPLGSFYSTNACITLNSWNHLVVAMTTSGIVMYCNGVSQPVTTFSGSNVQTTWTANSFDTLIIGGYKLNNTLGGLFRGQIDDVRIFNYALTAQQVKMLYNNNAAVRM